MRRPTEEEARRAIDGFLREELGREFWFGLVEDGDEDSAQNKCGWAFWLNSEDTTSYLHEDLTVEWYGTQEE
jgi:hypothetical protein